MHFSLLNKKERSCIVVFFNIITDEPTKAAAIVAFRALHQFGGVLLGEHLGQLFTILWTVMLFFVFFNQRLMPKWINLRGLGSGLIYLMAQDELFATVMPRFPVWDLAGLIGS